MIQLPDLPRFGLSSWPEVVVLIRPVIAAGRLPPPMGGVWGRSDVGGRPAELTATMAAAFDVAYRRYFPPVTTVRRAGGEPPAVQLDLETSLDRIAVAVPLAWCTVPGRTAATR
jgi:hypothetical protein